MRVVEIGILLGVSIFTYLPWIVLAILALSGIAVALVLAIIAVWAMWTGGQSPQGLGIELMIGLFLVWLHYEIKSRRETMAEFASHPVDTSNPVDTTHPIDTTRVRQEVVSDVSAVIPFRGLSRVVSQIRLPSP